MLWLLPGCVNRKMLGTPLSLLNSNPTMAESLNVCWELLSWGHSSDSQNLLNIPRLSWRP